ncbi:MAG: SUMF1/EgtB/PvdO family nonheme iron enzyme [Chloroflexota bacterium]
MAQIFVSYSRVDRHFVEALADKLRRIYGHGNVWFDEGLHGGDIWWEEILEQIASRDIFIYVLSNDSVQSDYCQAEFTEARRLQKQIITVQVRDRTRLTDELGDIHYINMANGVDDANALTDLYRSVNKRMTKVSRRPPKPLWEPPTPRPGKVDEKPRPKDAPHVDTPTLEVPLAERKNVRVEGKPRWKKRGFIIGAILVPIIAVALGAVIQNTGNNNTPATPPTMEVAQIASDELHADDARATGAAQAYATLTALAPTDTPTITPTPTDTPISSSDIQRTAQAEIFATETSAAGTQAVIAQQTQVAVLTEQFTAGETATYIAQLSLTPPATPTPRPTNTPLPPTFTPTPTITPRPTDTPDPLQAAFTPVGRNADWTLVEREFDGVTMVLVPAGCFMMGSEDGGNDETPVHEQCFDEPFWIDKYEVTNADYGSIGCERWSSDPDQPRNCVDWFDASDHCEARGARLPTEAEWEYAARGPDSLAYPWGSGFVANNVVYGSNSDNQTAPVGSRPGGASWVGALDMSGNVWEWTSSLYQDYPYGDDHESNSDTSSSRVLRGGSFYVTSYDLRSADRNWGDPDLVNLLNGFRCARSYE